MTGKLIITKGLPGSGKSTWAAQEIANNPDWVRVELDLLRDEYGISRSSFNEELEKTIREERDSRIDAALKEGKTVISSDTNLNTTTVRRLENIANRNKAKISFKDFTDVSPEECIRRDRLRQNSVGEEVILRMYSKIRNDDPITEDRKHLIIGDVHGDYLQLLSILYQHGIHIDNGVIYNPHNYYIFSLGDLNDPRLSVEEDNTLKMSSLKCIEIFYMIQKAGMGDVVQSNHHLNLINYFYGRRKKLSYGLNYTVAEIENHPDQQYIAKLITWLEARPYFYSFKENDTLYTCVHAYYMHGMSQYHPSGKEKEAALYGLNNNGSRVPWWRFPQYFRDDRVLISGHYHETGLFLNEEGDLRAILVDGGCGSDNGELVCYTPHDKKLFSFFNLCPVS